jgi:curved DNA-binding protein CbpA
MPLKDYYKTLEVTPAASQNDIKRSYRRLALKYHPDKNAGDKLYEAKFREINEAYDILSNPKKRQDYNSRRGNHTYGYARGKKYSPVTPQTILAKTIELRKSVASLDADRMNKVALYQQIQSLLSDSNIQLLQQHKESTLNKHVIEELLFCARHLAFTNIEQICFQLTALAGTDNPMYQRIYSFSKEMRLKSYWNRYKLLAAILISLLLCFAIYKISTSLY